MHRQLFTLIVAVMSVLAVSCGDNDDVTEGGFRIETDPAASWADTTGFVASGTAVDDGLLCRTGELTYVHTLHAATGEPETPETPPEDGDVMWVDKSFACDDGSGMFILRAELTVDVAAVEAAVGSGELHDSGSLTVTSGEDDYADITVEGTRQIAVVTAGTFDDGVHEVFSGTLTAG